MKQRPSSNHVAAVDRAPTSVCDWLRLRHRPLVGSLLPPSRGTLPPGSRGWDTGPSESGPTEAQTLRPCGHGRRPAAAPDVQERACHLQTWPAAARARRGGEDPAPHGRRRSQEDLLPWSCRGELGGARPGSSRHPSPADPTSGCSRNFRSWTRIGRGEPGGGQGPACCRARPPAMDSCAEQRPESQ